MSVKVYKNGAFHELVGKKIYTNGQWRTLIGDDRMYFNGQWHWLGGPYHNWTVTAKIYSFPMTLRAIESFDMYIDWGDGSIETIRINTSNTSINHFYRDSSVKQIRILKDDCRKLAYLSCENDQLTELDVSNSTALTQLHCGYNQLTELDVSNNTALTQLRCEFNQLTELDVSNSTALEWLSCESNQLTELDVSNSTALTQLHCHINQLTELDVSNNTALTQLRCYINQLTELDVSQNTALTFLNCSNNQLPSAQINNILSHLVSFGKSNGTLRCISQTPSAPPTGQGLIDKQTLIDRGWTVETD